MGKLSLIRNFERRKFPNSNSRFSWTCHFNSASFKSISRGLFGLKCYLAWKQTIQWKEVQIHVTVSKDNRHRKMEFNSFWMSIHEWSTRSWLEKAKKVKPFTFVVNLQRLTTSRFLMPLILPLIFFFLSLLSKGRSSTFAYWCVHV